MNATFFNIRNWLPWSLLLGLWIGTFFYMSTPLSEQVWCAWRAIFDLHCPGCGLTRSFCAMSAGTFVVAFQHHWAGPSLYIAMVWCILVWPLRYKSEDHAGFHLPNWMLWSYWSCVGVLFFGQALRVTGLWELVP